MPNPITPEELQRMILDDTVSDEQILQYVEVDPERSKAFQPVFKAREDLVIDPRGLEGAIAMNIFNKRSLRYRQKKYRKMIADGYDGIKIVSEGDSWFQYPLLLRDVIDQLFPGKYAVFSLGAAGDWLSNMVAKDEYTKVIREENPDIFLISGGGNDLVGDERLASLLYPYEPSKNAADYPNDKFAAFLEDITSLYRNVFSDLRADFSNLKFICHGYDYVIPDNGKWLGKPMKKIGITDTQLQEDIMRVVIDRLNEALRQVVHETPGAVHIDCRGVVSRNEWDDELHPENSGFENVAAKFVEAIESS